MFSEPTPSITPAQIAAALGWIASQAVAFGWLDTRPSQLALSIGSTALAVGWKAADAYLRGSRAKARLRPVQPPAAPPPTQ